MEKKMKWDDYLYCLICADMISAGLVNSNIKTLTFGCILYFVWEQLRKRGII